MASAYPPPAYDEPNRDQHLALMRDQPLATFILAAADEPFATPLPLVLRPDGKTLAGHLDANNPAAQLVTAGRQALAIFHGPNAYISPADYTTKQLPTYNYKQVFVRGTLAPITDRETIIADMHTLVEAMERGGRWTLPQGDPRVPALLPHIVAFHFHIESTTGRFKLSQDKNAADRAAAARVLGE